MQWTHTKSVSHFTQLQTEKARIGTGQNRAERKRTSLKKDSTPTKENKPLCNEGDKQGTFHANATVEMLLVCHERYIEFHVISKDTCHNTSLQVHTQYTNIFVYTRV